MKLLNSQEIAAKRAKEKHEFVTQYNIIVAQIDKKKQELLTLQFNLEKLRGELLTYINKLYEH